MQNSISTGFSNPLTRQWRKPLNLLNQGLLTLLLFSFVFATKAIGQAANIDQGQNGSATSRTSPVQWINGNLGPSGSHFAEGYSIPYRMSVSALVGTPTTVHHLIVEWDTKDQNGHALDYITYYDNMDNPSGSHQANFGHAAETITPTAGTAFSGAPTLFQIPAPSSTSAEVAGMPTQSFNDLPGAGRTNNVNATKMAIWGGTITALTYVYQNNQDATTASTKSSIDISFTAADGKTALIAWGGHIATEYDWGVGRGASKVSGSPYHMRLISIDGKGGNQDRSLKASAVLVPKPPCALTGNQIACEGTAGPITYQYTGSTAGITNYAWSFTSNTAGAKIDGTASGAGVTQVNIVPTDAAAGFTTGSFTLQLVTTNLGGTTTCTTSGTINQKVTTNAGIDQTVCASSPAVTLAGSVSGGASSGTWSGGTGTFNPSNTSLTATYTPSQAEITAGTVTLTLTSADPAGPCAATSDAMTITINRVATANAGGALTSCQSHTAQSVSLTGASAGGGATTGTWSIVSSNPANANNTLSDNSLSSGSLSVAADYVGVVTLRLTTNDPDGPCPAVTADRTVTITANPARPTVTYKGPECNETTFSVTVVGATTGGSYTLTQDAGGIAPVTKTTAANADASGNITFSGLTVGKGFSISLKVGDCTSDATDCGNYKTSTGGASTIQQTVMAQQIELNPQPTVKAAPNPYSDKVRFSVKSAVSGQGTLDLYNLLGQKVKTVFQGHVEAGQVQNFEYNVPNANRSNLIYIFRVGDQRVSGKLLH